MKWAASTLIFCAAVLIGLGMVMLYSSSMNDDQKKPKAQPQSATTVNNSVDTTHSERALVGARFLKSQFKLFLVGLVCAFVVASLDYRRFKKLSPYLLAVAAILLVLVFVPGIGHGANGARRWVGRGSLMFQPSELAKLALIIFLAAYADHYQRFMGQFWKGLVIPCLFIGLILGLIFREPDRGCTILLAAVCCVMLLVAGVKLWVLAAPAVLAVAGLAYSFMHDSMRMGRINAWLHPDQHADGAGYQGREAMIALGSGGPWGLGLGNGRQKLGFVPEHHTDFIFSIIGEELGLIATLAVVLLFLIIIFCGLRIALRACDTFGMMIAAGLTFMIGFQAFINIGVVTGVLPNKGMPLPFISFGGSNLVLMLVAVGMLVSVSRFAREPETVVRKSSNPFEANLGTSHA